MDTVDIQRAVDLREQVYNALRRRIMEGDYRPGDRLSEVQVSRDFGVSRTPAREALVMLTQAGLVQGSGRSFRLPIFSMQDVRSVFEIRRLIEGYAVRKIVQETDPAALREATKQMRARLTKNLTFKAYIRAHSEFRQILFDNLSNKILRRHISTFEEQVHFVRLTTLVDIAARERSAIGNLKLVVSVENGDAEGAAADMDALIDMSESLALAAMRLDGPKPPTKRTPRAVRAPASKLNEVG